MSEVKLQSVQDYAPADTRIGALLVRSGALEEADIAKVLEFSEKRDLQFGEAAIRLRLVSKSDVAYALAQQFDYPYLLPGVGDFDKELVAAYKPFTPRVEALRALRMQLMFRWFAAGHSALAVVSAGAGEGRTYLAANLAIVFSQLGDRTLLLDANLLQPRLHTVFRVDNKVGLSAALVGRTDGELNVQKVPHFANLWVLPAGAVPPNPDELLARNEYEAILQRLSREYDIILIDTPPGDSGIGAETIAYRCGGALLVAHRDHSKLAAVKKFKDRISARAELVGSVLSTF